MNDKLRWFIEYKSNGGGWGEGWGVWLGGFRDSLWEHKFEAMDRRDYLNELDYNERSNDGGDA